MMNCNHKCHTQGLNPWVVRCPICGCANKNYNPGTHEAKQFFEQLNPASQKPCSSESCMNDAVWQVGMNFYPPKHIGNVCAHSRTSLFICDECRHKTTLDDVLSNEGFDEIVRQFKSINRVPPDRKRTELTFYLLKSGTNGK